MTRFDLRRNAALGIGITVLAAVLASPIASAQTGGSDRMPGGVEARPSEPETGYKSRGLTPPPAAAARPTPPPPPLAQPAPAPPKAPDVKKGEAKKVEAKKADTKKDSADPPAAPKPKAKKSAPKPRAYETGPPAERSAPAAPSTGRGGGTDQIPGGVEHRPGSE